MEYVSRAALEAALDDIRRSPADEGRVELIVRRPAPGEREVLEEGALDPLDGLVGDGWRARGHRGRADGSPHPDMQLNVMNARAAAAMAGGRERWALAGDQLYVDFDLSTANLPPGTHLEVGSAIIEITAEPHRGCAKFTARFGKDAARFVNTGAGRELNLRGVNAKVARQGTVRRGDVIRKVGPVG